MFTARPVLQPAGLPATTHHGYNNNFPGGADTFHLNGNPSVPYKSSFFDVAHDYGLATAFYASKTRLAICDRSYDAVNGALDSVAPDDGRDKIDFASVVDLSGNTISNEVNLAISNLSSNAPANFSFIHLAEPDLTGHSSGWGSANWSNAVRMVDTQLGRIINTITANPVLSNRTVVIVTADHGGGGGTSTGHTLSSHVLNYTIPFFVWGPGIPFGENAYDLFLNRADPGTNRTDYTVSPQPIRNADGGNLGLALLGLPAIPGSFMLPELKSNLAPMRMPNVFGLAAADVHDHELETELHLNSVEWVNENEIAVEFALPPLQSAVVEYSADLSQDQWEPVAEYSAEKKGRSVQLRVPGTVNHGFFRVRAP